MCFHVKTSNTAVCSSVCVCVCVARIIELKRKVCDKGQGFIVINQKGIDPIALEMLCKENIVGIRRAKRRCVSSSCFFCGVGRVLSIPLGVLVLYLVDRSCVRAVLALSSLVACCCLFISSETWRDWLCLAVATTSTQVQYLPSSCFRLHLAFFFLMLSQSLVSK